IADTARAIVTADVEKVRSVQSSGWILHPDLVAATDQAVVAGSPHMQIDILARAQRPRPERQILAHESAHAPETERRDPGFPSLPSESAIEFCRPIIDYRHFAVELAKRLHQRPGLEKGTEVGHVVKGDQTCRDHA